ncbi:MAG: IPT/TIG domain-containing protein [Kangiellaceae bacterium]|nr:IPT/TIG domain-containing protein [Kangiellaceae bacterium]
MYYYYPRPSIFTLIPDKGPLSGGNKVLIEGEFLDPFNDKLREVNNHNDTICRFGDVIVPITKFWSDNLIEVEAPPSPVPRTVLLDITLNRADTKLNPQDWTDDFVPYTYYAMPYLYDINPRVGPTSGNTTVYAYGTNFNRTEEISCKFGD